VYNQPTLQKSYNKINNLIFPKLTKILNSKQFRPANNYAAVAKPNL